MTEAEFCEGKEETGDELDNRVEFRLLLKDSSKLLSFTVEITFRKVMVMNYLIKVSHMGFLRENKHLCLKVRKKFSDSFFPPCPAPLFKMPGVEGHWCIRSMTRPSATRHLLSNSFSGPHKTRMGHRAPWVDVPFSASSSRMALSALSQTSVPRRIWNSCLRAEHGWSLYLEHSSPDTSQTLPHFIQVSAHLLPSSPIPLFKTKTFSIPVSRYICFGFHSTHIYLTL